MIKRVIVGTALTLVIGGSAYTVKQSDVIDNFSKDTGQTQQQAEDYVKNVDKKKLIPYDKLGTSMVDDGNKIVSETSTIDCDNYTYAWVSASLTCALGKNQLAQTGNDEISLGQSYIKLSTKTASRTDISNTVGLIDTVNSDYNFEIVNKLLDSATILESKNSNSYNKATLNAALKSNQK